MKLGACVLCGGRLGTYGREVWTRLDDGRRPILGYACRACIRQATAELDGRPVVPRREAVAS